MLPQRDLAGDRGSSVHFRPDSGAPHGLRPAVPAAAGSLANPSDRVQASPEPASGTAQWRESARRAILSAVLPPVRLLLVDDNHDLLELAAAHLRNQPQLSTVGAVRSLFPLIATLFPVATP